MRGKRVNVLARCGTHSTHGALHLRSTTHLQLQRQARELVVVAWLEGIQYQPLNRDDLLQSTGVGRAAVGHGSKGAAAPRAVQEPSLQLAPQLVHCKGCSIKLARGNVATWLGAQLARWRLLTFLNSSTCPATLSAMVAMDR